MRTRLPLLVFLLLFKGCLMGCLIALTPIDLGPDEAQYWTWSQLLDIGYYSKPAGIAYQMAATTAMIGNTPFGVRFGPLLIAFFLPLMIYGIAKQVQLSDKESFWAATVMAFCPIGILASFLATTDGGFLLFWTAALYLLAKSTKQDQFAWKSLAAVVCLGAFFKWPMYWIWVICLIASFWIHNWRTYRLLWAVLLSFLALVPSLVWNMENEWATFRHVGSTVIEPAARGTKGNPIEFFGAQVGLLTPIFFLFWVMGLYKVWDQRKKLNQGLLLMTAISFGIVAVHLLISCTKKLQGNWCVWAYPAAMIPIAFAANSQKGRFWLKTGVALSISALCLAFFLPTLQKKGYAHSLAFKNHPWRHLLGWSQLQSVIASAETDHQGAFLFADRYQTASLISFYSPQQKRSYFLHLSGVRKNQFSFWPGIEDEQIGNDGIFVWVETTDRINEPIEQVQQLLHQKLSPFFAEVVSLPPEALWSTGNRVDKIALLFHCQKYNGKTAEASQLF